MSFKEMSNILAQCDELESVHPCRQDPHTGSLKKVLDKAKRNRLEYSDLIKIGRLMSIEGTLEGEKLIDTSWIFDKLAQCKAEERRR